MLAVQPSQTSAAKETSFPLSPEYINSSDWELRHINHCSMSQCSSGYSVPNSCEHFNLGVYDADEDGCMMWSQDVSGSGPEGPGDVETYWEQQSEFQGGYTEALFLWESIEPLYQKLHAFVSKQLSRHCFSQVYKQHSFLFHLLGTVAGNDWAYIADHVLYLESYQRLLASVTRKVFGGMNVYKAAENMTVDLGLGPLAAEFWEQTWFNSSCPAHVISYCESGIARVITCNLTGWPEYLDAYESVMRIKHIQLAEKENTFILRDNNHYSSIYEHQYDTKVTGVPCDTYPC
ncbi:angiotensin-converting enzyme-like [Cryptotermes secundus]|uniref:angiotensin-converting enzyme-like n=1 Tax=Cryptotermes secundus TaxID=105785 RepID=UPI001454D7A8|nr:angiotensin-converting enzyme-like [Cryptotermes secundus]